MNTKLYSQSRPQTPSRPSTSHDHKPSTPTAFNTNDTNITSPSPRPAGSYRKPRAPHPTLPSLPRFHPANYISSNTSSLAAITNSTSTTSPTTPPVFDPSTLNSGPLSPRTTSTLRQYPSDAQRQLYLYQRELLSLNRTSSSPHISSFGTPSHSGNLSSSASYAATPNGMLSPTFRHSRPQSPHLVPVGSPGPVTPLFLEGETEAGQCEGYLLARAECRKASGTELRELGIDETVDGLIGRQSTTLGHV